MKLQFIPLLLGFTFIFSCETAQNTTPKDAKTPFFIAIIT